MRGSSGRMKERLGGHRSYAHKPLTYSGLAQAKITDFGISDQAISLPRGRLPSVALIPRDHLVSKSRQFKFLSSGQNVKGIGYKPSPSLRVPNLLMLRRTRLQAVVKKAITGIERVN